MRFGLMSDVHGNLPALRAVRAALADEGTLDSVIVAGDLLLGRAWPNEVWDILTADGYVLVQGNTDAELGGLMAPALDARHPTSGPTRRGSSGPPSASAAPFSTLSPACHASTG
jgi:predicted phosphodiesterase